MSNVQESQRVSVSTESPPPSVIVRNGDEISSSDGLCDSVSSAAGSSGNVTASVESSLGAGGQASTSQDAQSSGPTSSTHDTATLPTQPVLDAVFQPDLSPVQSSFAPEDFLNPQTQRPSFSASRPSIGPSTGGLVPSPQAQSKTEALERQPRSATGYEWNERNTASGTASDGTASLSVEPDGEGYLGFASGATLLRILQMTAGGITLPHTAQQQSEVDLPANWHPTEVQLDQYLTSYFAHYHTQYPIIHEPTFRAQFQQVLPQPPPSRWKLLSNAVIGLGAFCCSQSMQICDYFLDQATSSISAEILQSGSLDLVQAFCLLSNLAQKRNKSNTGSVYLGIAVRMAIGLGLHRELPFWNITPFEREVRRRVWWVVFIFDAGAAITFGRPILLPSDEADVNVVRNVWDRAFPPAATVEPPGSPLPTIYSSLIHQSSFHVTGNRCYNRVISSPPPSPLETLQLDHTMQEWLATLPSWLSPESTGAEGVPWLEFSVQKLFWRYCNLRIIIGRRAFLEQAVTGRSLSHVNLGDGNDSVDAQNSANCLQSALDTIRAIHKFCWNSHSNRLELWYALHFLFHASFVPLIALHCDQSSLQRSEWFEALDLARSVLELSSAEPLAQRCLQIINLLAPSKHPPEPDIWQEILRMTAVPDVGAGGVNGPETILRHVGIALAGTDGTLAADRWIVTHLLPRRTAQVV